VAELFAQQQSPQDQQQNQPQAPDQKPDEPQAKPPDKAEEKKPPTPAHTGVRALLYGLKEDVQHLPSRPNLYLTLLGGGLALAAHPADATFNNRLISHYDVVNTAFRPGKIVGQTGVQTGLALATYVFGRATDRPKASHFGMDMLRAQIIAEGLTEALKFSTHRERPNHSNHQSFPSGHASVTFASATVIERHLGWKYSVLGYTIASYVAASRLHDNRHYLSDVVFGAAVGAIAGRTVTQHGRDVWTFAPAAVPGGGIAVLATRTAW
jgi:membrane-associated phospholipid phosphatase